MIRSTIKHLGLCCVAVTLLVAPGFTQSKKKRPQLVAPQRLEFAARILLIPLDGRPVSWKLPRAIARVCDVEILLPPAEMLGDSKNKPNADAIISWARRQDYGALDAVIMSLDVLAGSEARYSIVEWMRQQKPGLQISAFARHSNDQISKLVFDDLMIDKDHPDLAHVLLARHLNRVFKRPPRLWPIVSNEVTVEAKRLIDSLVKAVGGLTVSDKPDVIVFINVAKGDAAKLTNLIDALAKAAAAGYYVAVADVSDDPEPLMQKLREARKLDLLTAYSASKVPVKALSNVFAQVSARLIAAKVLRTQRSPEQLQRMERSQVELLLTRYLEDWAYPGTIRPIVEKFPVDKTLAYTADTSLEQVATNEMRTLAGDLFTQQFRRNIHTILTADGSRIALVVGVLQRCNVRFPADNLDDVEVDVGVHLEMMMGMPAPRR